MHFIYRIFNNACAVDGPIAQNFDAVAAISLFTIVKLGLIVFFSPIFILPCVLVVLVGIWFGQIYNKTVLSVKREMNNAKAPVLAHFGAAITGLGMWLGTPAPVIANTNVVSIRAYGAQSAFKTVSLGRIDKYTRTARTFHNLGWSVNAEHYNIVRG